MRHRSDKSISSADLPKSNEVLLLVIVEAAFGILSTDSASNMPNKRCSLPTTSVKAIESSKDLDNDGDYSDVIIL